MFVRCTLFVLMSHVRSAVKKTVVETEELFVPANAMRFDVECTACKRLVTCFQLVCAEFGLKKKK